MQFVDSAFAHEVLRYLGAHGIAAGLVSPTATAMRKSIIDATEPFRDFLRAEGIHDFSAQFQGEEYKQLLQAEYVYSNKLLPTTVSFYRPQTKAGDPRIWFYRLKEYARPDDLLALIRSGNRLFIINANDTALMDSINDPSTTLGSIAWAARGALSQNAAGLLIKLRKISALGFVQTVRIGDTGVGATLESLLGIASNNSRQPDYMGIEIKASRQNRQWSNAKNRVNLFSQVPDWLHPFSQTASNAATTYGYSINGRQQLYCTVDAIKPNSQGLILWLDVERGDLRLLHRAWSVETTVFIWSLDKLRARLKEKHPESFWVKADVNFFQSLEHFHYHSAVHTSKPLLSNFALAIADGTITLDLTMSIQGGGVRDHGYLFKIWPSDLTALFPAPMTYRLYD